MGQRDRPYFIPRASRPVLPRDKKFVLIADAGREEEAALRLGRIGLDLVVGYVRGGLGALVKAAEPLTRTERLTAKQLKKILAAPGAPAVLDVRGAGERAQNRIEGSAHVPLDQLEVRLRDVPRGPLVVHCAGGYRSMIAASILERAGRQGVRDLEGGMAAWLA